MPAASLCDRLYFVAAIVSFGASAAFGQAMPCPDIENDAERLACYDRAATAPASAAVAAAPAPSSTVAPPVAASTSAPAPASAAKDEVVTIVITGVRTVQGRSTTFTAADGTVWAQNDSQTLRNLPETPFDAELKPGAMGSRFLVPKGSGRSIRVRLVR